jgi:hypothetical protein
MSSRGWQIRAVPACLGLGGFWDAELSYETFLNSGQTYFRVTGTGESQARLAKVNMCE